MEYIHAFIHKCIAVAAYAIIIPNAGVKINGMIREILYTMGYPKITGSLMLNNPERMPFGNASCCFVATN